jgi:hypothetical protein
MDGASNADAYLIAFNAALFALCMVPLALVVGLIRQIISARRVPPDFSLQKLEAIELDRSILLYEKASNCLKEIEQRGYDATSSLWARYRVRVDNARRYGGERKDLEAYARHLRATIFRLRRLPIERFKTWVHIVSARSAFGRSLAAYLLITAALTAILYVEEVGWTEEIRSSLDALLLWQPADERALCANWVAAVFGLVSAPVFYFTRRAKLHSAHRHETRNFREFAATDPDRLIAQRLDDRAGQEAGDEELFEPEPKREWFDQESAQQQSAEQPAPFEAAGDDRWHIVLGVSPWATIEEVKQAYKAQIKRNHPDRVHGMSSLFSELAEAETKRLNAAYEEALMSLRPLDYVLNGGSSSQMRH